MRAIVLAALLAEAFLFGWHGLRVPRGFRALANMTFLTVSPTTISFTASDPDLGTVAGTPATVSFRATKQVGTKNWTLTAAATAATLTSCPSVPSSAVRVTCSSALVTGTGDIGTAACAGPINLSTVPQLIASGRQGDRAQNYYIDLTFAFTDSWRYPGASSPQCSLSLTYTADFP